MECPFNPGLALVGLLTTQPMSVIDSGAELDADLKSLLINGWQEVLGSMERESKGQLTCQAGWGTKPVLTTLGLSWFSSPPFLLHWFYKRAHYQAKRRIETHSSIFLTVFNWLFHVWIILKTDYFNWDSLHVWTVRIYIFFKKCFSALLAVLPTCR